MLVSVFDTVDDHLWFHDREWTYEWDVVPEFTDPQLNLLPLYDRTTEHKHGDGFLLQSLLFVYEEYRAMVDDR